MAKSLDRLAEEISKSVELSTSAAVTNTLKKIDEEKKQKPDYFDEVDDVFDALTRAIPKFTNKNSNTADIFSGICDVASAVVKVGGLLTGQLAVAGALSYALKLVGSVIGVFGSSKTTRYFAALTEMVNAANNTSLSKDVNQQLGGAMHEIYSRHIKVSWLLSIDFSVEKNDLQERYGNEITTEYFRQPGIFELGAAFKNLDANVSKDSRANWANAAGTYYMASQLMGIKILFYLEGIAYFNLAEKDAFSATSRYNAIQHELDGFRASYLRFSGKFFGRPSVAYAAITQYIYRLDEPHFKLVAHVFDFLDEERVVPFWPVGEKSKTWFTCNIKHTAPGVNNVCLRATTLFANFSNKDSDHRVLTIHGDGGSTANKIYYAEGRASTPPLFEKDNSKEISNQGRTHFELTEIGNFDHKHYEYPTEGKQTVHKIIPFEWMFKAKNSQLEAEIGSTLPHKSVVYYENNIFIFRVYPTQAELENLNNGFWPNGWQNKPHSDRSYVMIGSNKNDLIWCDHKGKGDLKKESFYDIVYNSEHYGNPEHCLWFALQENEK